MYGKKPRASIRFLMPSVLDAPLAPKLMSSAGRHHKQLKLHAVADLHPNDVEERTLTAVRLTTAAVVEQEQVA